MGLLLFVFSFSASRASWRVGFESSDVRNAVLQRMTRGFPPKFRMVRIARAARRR
jgi:hypothetical protein